MSTTFFRKCKDINTSQNPVHKTFQLQRDKIAQFDETEFIVKVFETFSGSNVCKNVFKNSKSFF